MYYKPQTYKDWLHKSSIPINFVRFGYMSNIKQLAGQTMWYGLSSIAARFINYLLTPILTYAAVVTTEDYGKIGLLYSAIPILNVVFTYGFETAYFRFSNKDQDRSIIYNTAFLSLFFTTVIFSFLLYTNPEILIKITGIEGLPVIINYAIFIIALDAISAIPFARLRQDGRPKKYALIRVISILVNVLLTGFFIGYCPKHYDAQNPDWIVMFYDPETNPVVYVLLANLIQNIVTVLLLSGEILKVKFKFDFKLWKQMLIYAAPLLLVGFGGVINETFDRLMLRKWLPGTDSFKQSEVGVYNACYKLSILITLFIQAFRMSAEPFFFKQAEGQNPQRVYARVMKFFVIVICTMFLVVVMYVDIWKLMIGPQYRVGLAVVPILLLANMFLGIYYNLSIWYKLANKTIAGAYITLIGAAITLGINFFLIPHFSYMACAWATFACYGSMMVISFIWGQKHYRVPYAWKKLVAYMVIVVLFYLIHALIKSYVSYQIINYAIATLLLFIFLRFILLVEKSEFKKLPVVGRFIK